MPLDCKCDHGEVYGRSRRLSLLQIRRRLPNSQSTRYRTQHPERWNRLQKKFHICYHSCECGHSIAYIRIGKFNERQKTRRNRQYRECSIYKGRLEANINYMVNQASLHKKRTNEVNAWDTMLRFHRQLNIENNNATVSNLHSNYGLTVNNTNQRIAKTVMEQCRC